MGFWSSACSVVSSACSAVGSMFSGALSVVGKFIPQIEIVIRVIDVVIKVIDAVCKVLGIWQKDDNPEELGDKAIQGAEAGVTRDKFDTYDEYLKKIREVKLDPEISSKIPVEAKFAAATTLGILGLESFYQKDAGSLADLILVIGKNPEFFDANRIKAYLDAGINTKLLSSYLNGSASAGSELSFLKSALGVEQALTGKNDADVYKDLDNAMRHSKGNMV